MKVRSPRGATHALRFGQYDEVFYRRCGRIVFEFLEARGQWFRTRLKPHRLLECRRLNVFEMHPETAAEKLQVSSK